MTRSRERLLRTAAAAVVAALASLLVVSNYHPCEGIGALVVLTAISAGITLASGFPGFRARVMLGPGLAATAVLAVAVGLDYSNSGMTTDGIDQCEPVAGFAGFLLAAFISGVLAALGTLGVLFVAWFVHGAIHLQAVRSARRQPEIEGNNG